MKITKTFVKNQIIKLGLNPNWKSKHTGDTLLDRVIAELVEYFPPEVIHKAYRGIRRENFGPYNCDDPLKHF